MTHHLLSLLRLGLLTSEAADEEKYLLPLSMSQWREVMDLAERQGVAAIAFDGIQKLYDEYQKNIKAVKVSSQKWLQFVLDYTGMMTQYEQAFQQQRRVVRKIAEILASENVKMMVFKGQANAVYYPIPYHRATGDIDCWLFGEAEKGDTIMRGKGALVSFDWYRHSKISFQGELIENHRVLGHTKGGKKRKQMDAEFQALTQSHDQTYLDGCGQTLKPSAQFNACFLTYHSLNHFISEGLRMKQVLDWAMFLDKEQDNVDWHHYNEFCIRYKLERFAAVMNYIVSECLGVSLNNSEIIADGYYAKRVLQSTLYDDDYLFNSGKSKWHIRWLLIKNMFTRDRWKYRNVAQRNIWSQLLQDLFGFLFEKD